MDLLNQTQPVIIKIVHIMWIVSDYALCHYWFKLRQQERDEIEHNLTNQKSN